MPLVSAATLEDIATYLFQAWGVPLLAAHVVARHLVDSSLAGVDTHGIIRLPQYLDQIDRHEIDPLAQITTVSDRGPVVLLDGNYAFGPAAAVEGARLVAPRAREHGIALVCLRHIGHAGRIGAYTEQMAHDGILALAFCSSPMHGHYMPPPGAREGRLATNPISFAFPAPDGPVIADFSTSSIPEGAVRLLRDRHQAAPPDTLIDAQGSPTTDPTVLYADPRGSILPLGGVRFGHKGFSLGLLVEVLASTLAGDLIDDPTVRGNNLALLGIDVRLTPPTGSFDMLAAHLVDYIRSAQPIDDAASVIMPGEKERKTRAARLQTGVPVDDFTWQAIVARATRVGYTLPQGIGTHE